MNNEKCIQNIKSQLDIAGTTLGILNIKTNIQVYFLTNYENKQALTKNVIFRFQGDDKLPSSSKKYDFLDSLKPLQITKSVNEKTTKYLHITDDVRHPKQGFVVASPIVSQEYGIIGSLCFAGGEDPVLDKLISEERFTMVAEVLSKSLATSFEFFSKDELEELAK